MSKGEILFVKGMSQMSESDEEEVDDNIWDDCKLNEAYDVAVSTANAEIAKRVAMATNNRKPIPAPPISKTMKKSKASSSKLEKTSPLGTKWAAGMPCRALFEEDGLEYEAFLLRTINDKECVVRFLGYENSEIVSIGTLKPSLGDEERARQIQEALSDCTVQPEDKIRPRPSSEARDVERMEYGSDRTHSSERSHHKKKSSKKKIKKISSKFELPDDLPFPMPPNMAHLRNMSLGSMDIPMPPPPVTFAHSDRPDSEEQAVSSMLMSWYMSGYYTGLYQGMKRAKNSSRRHH